MGIVASNDSPSIDLLQGLICFESIMQDAAARGIVSDGAPVICKPSRKVSVAELCRVCESSYDAIYDVRPVMKVSTEGLFGSYMGSRPILHPACEQGCRTSSQAGWLRSPGSQRRLGVHQLVPIPSFTRLPDFVPR